MHATSFAVAILSPYDLRKSGKSLNPWLWLSIFLSRLLQLCRRKIAFPALQVHIVRMESDSCDVFVSHIDEPA